MSECVVEQGTAPYPERPGAHPVIIVHGIGTPQRSLEPGEDAFWLSQAQYCEALDLIVQMGSAAPHITFDDGNASDIQIAVPELEKRNLKATFFLLVGRLGQPGSLTEQDVSDLAKAGHQIGLHGYDHVDWRHLNDAARIHEFEAARTRLSALSGCPVTTVAAPFGLYNRQTVQDLRALGFRALYTSDRGLARAENFIRPRNCLEGAMSHTDLDAALRGRISPMRHPRRLLGIARKRLLPVRTRT